MKVAVAHGVLAIVWALLTIPTVLYWRESLLWVAFMSIYAIIQGHAGSVMASLAARRAKEIEESNDG